MEKASICLFMIQLARPQRRGGTDDTARRDTGGVGDARSIIAVCIFLQRKRRFDKPRTELRGAAAGAVAVAAGGAASAVVGHGHGVAGAGAVVRACVRARRPGLKLKRGCCFERECRPPTNRRREEECAIVRARRHHAETRTWTARTVTHLTQRLPPSAPAPRGAMRRPRADDAGEGSAAASVPMAATATRSRVAGAFICWKRVCLPRPVCGRAGVHVCGSRRKKQSEASGRATRRCVGLMAFFMKERSTAGRVCAPHFSAMCSYSWSRGHTRAWTPPLLRWRRRG